MPRQVLFVISAYHTEHDRYATRKEAVLGRLEIVVYSQARCPYCSRARRLLRRNGYAFEEIDVGKDEGLRQRLIRSTGQKTVPLVLLDGRLLGGFADLRRLERTGDLERLVRGRS